MARRRSWWGWGWEDEALTPDQRASLAKALCARLGIDEVELRDPPSLADVDLPTARVTVPTALADIVSTDGHDRAAHTYGKSFRDVVRAFNGDLSAAPDAVAHPRDEDEIVDVLEWADDADLAVVPYGGGSSVVGGVEANGTWSAGFDGVVTLDLGRLDRVLDIDTTSRAACVQAGVFGPDLEDQLRPHGYTMRHYPQSFEHSTLGGWIATRSGGH